MSSPTSNINDHFFDGNYKEVWRRMIPPGLSEAECEFIEDVAALQKGDRVLDLMCGFGRHTLPLARRGFRIDALDNSSAYLSEIESIAFAEALPIDCQISSALEATFSHHYKAVICMGNSFAFFNRADGVALLLKIAKHLKEDGILVINSWMIAEIAIKHFREKEWYEVQGYKYLLDYRFCFQPSRIESEHTIISSDGTIESLKGVDYVFTLAELEEMFREAGLTTKIFYSTPRKRPFKMGDNRIYIIAGKIGQALDEV
jgi:cyclopropane fatty-acyl-phospholipid synthase-like methyltransferase